MIVHIFLFTTVILDRLLVYPIVWLGGGGEGRLRVFHRSPSASEILCHRRTAEWSRSSPAPTLLSHTALMFSTQMWSKPNVLPVFFVLVTEFFFHRKPSYWIETTIQRVSHWHSRVIVTCGSTPITSIPGACSLFFSLPKMIAAVGWIIRIFLLQICIKIRFKIVIFYFICVPLRYTISHRKPPSLCSTQQKFNFNI